MELKALKITPLLLVSMLIFSVTFSLSAQPSDDSVCAYTWNSDLNDCPDVLECVWPEEWQDTVVQIASNVTRISKDSMKLCFEDLHLSIPPDIIYIIDFSGSMRIGQIYPAGDPHQIRDDAFEAGVNYQINNQPNSTAGFIGFGANVPDTATLIPTNVRTGTTELQNMVQKVRRWVDDDPQYNLGGTDYREPLDTAINWIQNICQSSNKAIIFISDGEPNSGLEPLPSQITTLSQNNVPVYGIFLGDTASGGELIDLSNNTGGEWWAVDPQSSDTLGQLVESIVEHINKIYYLESLTVNNQTTNAISNSVNSWSLGDSTTWVVELDKFIPLQPDLNAMRIDATFRDTTQSPPVDTSFFFTFQFDVSGPNTQECYYCWLRAEIEILSNGQPVDTLSWQNDSFTVQLKYYGYDTLNSVQVLVQTSEKGDYELITIDTWTHNGTHFVFEKTIPFSVIGGPPATNNITEANPNDSVAVFWQHPVDTRDTARTHALVRNNPWDMATYDQAGDPTGLTPYPSAPTINTITTDNPTPLFAKIFSASQKWLEEFEDDPNLSKLITWTATDINGNPFNPALGYLTADSTNANSFVADSAFHTVRIIINLDIGIGLPVADTLLFYIAPGAPDQLVIESTNDSSLTADKWNPVPWDPIHIYSNMTGETAYAILRDRKGNWIGPATSAEWTSNDPTIVTVGPGPSDVGAMTRGTVLAGRTGVRAQQNTLFDTTTVYTWNQATLEVLYDDNSIDTLSWNHESYTIRLTYPGHDTLASVAIQVNDQKGDVETITINSFTHNGFAFIFEQTVPFEISLPSVPAVPNNGTNEANPVDLISFLWKHPTSTSDSAETSVVVANNPDRVDIYREGGDPTALTPYPAPPAIDTMTTDNPAPLFAKVFTDNTRWLAGFETNPEWKKLITWTALDTNNIPFNTAWGRLASDSTNENYFHADSAYHVVKIIAALDVKIGLPIADTILIFIGPGAPAQIVIEETNDMSQTPSLHTPVHYDPIHIRNPLNEATAYAILRDAKGNWFGPATNAAWTSNDPNVAAVSPGPSDVGTITRGPTLAGKTGIQAVQDGMEDTATVYTWNNAALEVLYNDSLIDTLTWRHESYTLRLSYYGHDTMQSVTILATTQKGDQETITINGYIHTGTAFIYQTTVPFSATRVTLTPTPNNGTTEADLNDLLYCLWKHPASPPDSAEATVIVANSPETMDIYRQAGDPATLTPYPALPTVDTMTTDVPAPLFAKIFTDLTAPRWLAAFESDSVLKKMITWKATDLAGNPFNPLWGSLSTDSTNENYFTADSAYHTVKIIAAMDIGIGLPIADTILLYIKPGAAAQLVIEATNDINQTNLHTPLHWDPIHIYNNMTSVNAYAILRDAKGNWFGPATSARWTSNDSAIATVSPGPSDLGTITRGTALTGKTGIHATQNGLEDTTTVVIWSQAKLEVLYNDNIIDTLNWRQDHYTVRLSYHGHDTISPAIITVNTQKGDVETITIPNFTHNGVAFVYKQDVPFKVSVAGVAPTPGDSTTEANLTDLVALEWKHPTSPASDFATDTVVVSNNPLSMALYNAVGNPATLTPYSIPPITDTITTDFDTPIFTKVFTDLGRWLAAFETDPSLQTLFLWSATDTNGMPLDSNIGYLTANNNNSNTFVANAAYHTVIITASLDVGIGLPLSASVRFYINPGVPAQLVIEETNDITQADLNNPSPWDPINMYGNMNTLTAYAILRDAKGNWVEPATSALWTSRNVAVVTISPGPSDAGVIVKGTLPSGQTGIHAIQGTFEDTSTVITHPYAITALRIVRVHAATDTADIVNLDMHINRDTMLVAIGQRSDNNLWIPVDADWAIDTPVTNPIPPLASSFWRFTALDPASGIITANLTLSNATVLRDTVHFNFSIPAITSIEFKLLTPDSLRIAGQPITAYVNIYNQYGLVPGIWKYPKGTGLGGVDKAGYHDELGNGNLSFIPYAKTFDSTVLEDSSSLDPQARVTQTFRNGTDTLQFVLYYAPWQEYKHRLVVQLDNLTAMTDSFVLHPGPVDSVHLIDQHNVPFPDTLLIISTDPVFPMKAMAYDEFGNYLKYEPLLWSNDPSLVDYAITSNQDIIYFNPGLATQNQQGHVTVTATKNPAKFNNVYIIMKGPLPTVAMAKTKDYNGNGFLDAIALQFDREVTLPPVFSCAGVVVENIIPSRIIPADTIIPDPINDRKSFHILLDETQSKIDNIPQTGWRPYLSISNIDSISTITNFECLDGSGPVIWKIVKKIENLYDRTKDRVTLTLSEPFFHFSGVDFLSMGPVPDSSSLYVWTFDTLADTIVRVDSILQGNIKYDQQLNEQTVFTMSNGKDLNGKHLINLDSLRGFVADVYHNLPNENNQKVRVLVDGTMGEIHVGPVPIIPTLNPVIHNHVEGPLIHINPNTAINWVKTNGGTLINLDILLTVGPDGKLIGTWNDPNGPNYASGVLLIFDNIGNRVFKKKSENNLIPQAWFENIYNVPGGESPIQKLCFYWDGITEDDRKASPGLYKIIVYIYMNKQQISFGKTVAVGR